MILEFIIQFITCKKQSQAGTSALFVVPMWVESEFWKLITKHPKVFFIIRRFPWNTPLFTSPNQAGTARKHCGNTKWPVVVVWVPPTIIPELANVL